MGISCNLYKVRAALGEHGCRNRELLVTRDVHDVCLWSHAFHELHPRQLRRHCIANIFNPGIRIRGLIAIGQVRSLLNQPAIESFHSEISCEEKSAFPLPSEMLAP